MRPRTNIDIFFFLMIRRPPRSTLDRSSAASDVYKRQVLPQAEQGPNLFDGKAQVARLADEAQRADLLVGVCLLYTSPSPRDRTRYRMPSSA